MFGLLSRSMATAAKSVQAPIKLSGVEGRYASALYCAAFKNGSLDRVDLELKTVKQLLNVDAGVKRFLETPTIHRQAKKKGIEVILGKDKSETTVNFFSLLAENGRLGETVKILAAFDSLMVAHRGEVNVVVTSALELDAKSLAKIKEVLTKNELGGAGKKLLIVNKVLQPLNQQVDPQIVGGLVVEIGDNTIDLSVSSKITKLNSLLTQAV